MLVINKGITVSIDSLLARSVYSCVVSEFDK